MFSLTELLVVSWSPVWAREEIGAMCVYVYACSGESESETVSQRIPLGHIRECLLDGARLDVVRGRKVTRLRYRGTDWRDNEQRMRALSLLLDQLRLSKHLPLLNNEVTLAVRAVCVRALCVCVCVSL